MPRLSDNCTITRWSQHSCPSRGLPGAWKLVSSVSHLIRTRAHFVPGADGRYDRCSWMFVQEQVHSSVGQLKGEDGSLHYFPRESCYLYGVPLHNVELWHVLAQDDPVLYTVMELVPGMMKVQKVWLGALELPDKKIASEYIFAWCQMKLVPDGARDILISQLEML
ncbi:hypothetical protein O3P69_013401 [Scylla paramamosain]|uniref:Uncharacterized protein n=1 Tax=Scylla paramamosain TaxID=85552 RepID=A0AAW0U3L6_SCYPA